MNSKVRATVSAVLGMGAAGLSQVSAAEVASQASGNDAGVLQTIIVTAEKREESLKDVPMSVTAVTGAKLDDLQLRAFSDYAALVPGLSLTSGQSGQTRLTLRGQNTGGVGSTVAVYLDESPFGSSNALLNGSVNAGDFDTWDMKRIEVLRGPQGTLYGANSEGGLLKFVSNAPELGKFSFAGEAGGEAVNFGGTGWSARAMANLPLGKTMAFRVSGFYDELAGYIDDPSLGLKDLNKGKKYGGRASFLFEPTADFSVQLTAATQTSTYDGTNTVDVDPVSLQPLYGDLKQERLVAEPSSFRYEDYNATIDWNVGPFSVLSATSYGKQDAFSVEDATPLLGGYVAFLPPPLGDATPLAGKTDLKKFTQEVRLTSPTSDHLEWQLGGFYTHEDGVLLQNLYSVVAPNGPNYGSILTPEVDSTYEEGAGFLNLTYHFTSQFDIQAGGRYSHNSQNSTQTTSYNPQIGLPPVVVDGKSSENVWTYSVAPSFHFSTDTMAYARVATGYRPGGPNVLPPTATPEQIAEFGQYHSDKTTNYELGIRSTRLDGRFSLDIALFHVDWKNVQLFEVVDSFGINVNGARATSQGVEWNFGYAPVQGLTFQWTGAFTDAQLRDAAPALGALDGARLPYVPKWSTGLDGEYKWIAFKDYSAFLGGTYSYVGSRRTAFASSATDPTGQATVGSYNQYDARLGLDNGRFRVTLYGKNLSDSRGITNFSGAGSPYPSITVTQPLTVGVTLSAKF